MWGAFNVTSLKNLSTLHHPVPYVVIGHMGVQTESCFNIYTCSIKMRAIQDNGIGTKQMADLGGNFYVSYLNIKFKSVLYNNSITFYLLVGW